MSKGYKNSGVEHVNMNTPAVEKYFIFTQHGVKRFGLKQSITDPSRAGPLRGTKTDILLDAAASGLSGLSEGSLLRRMYRPFT